MRPARLLLSALVAIILIVLLTAGGLVWYNARRMLPQHDGVKYISGLHDEVKIIRDEWGVPHIYASNADDLFFAEGYVQAQDRWWQMEFYRHTGQGRIEELTGYNAGVLGSDLFIRTVGWNRAALADAEFISDDTMTVLEAYSAGINAYIGGKHGGDLALEYSLLGVTGIDIEVEPWKPVDTLGWAIVMAHDLGGNRGAELERMQLYAELGETMTDAYLPLYPYDLRPVIVPESELPLSENSLNTSPAHAPAPPEGVNYASLQLDTTVAGGVSGEFAALLGEGTGIGSNNLVISGSNTASGAPLLANDPHLGIQLPSIWYEIGLHCRPVSEACPYDVVGFTFPAAPGVVIGHNQRIAWGVTNLDPDVQDLYIIRINPDNPLQYEYDGEWRDMETATEVIHFGSAYKDQTDDPTTEKCEGISGLTLNGAGDLEIQARITHFGPIITDNKIVDCQFVAQSEGDALAMRWTALEPGDLMRGVISINRASNWAEFREALSHWDWPSQNFVYADTDGNIGYQMPGKSPIRAADHSGLVPVPGWTSDYEWQGYIPYDMLPRMLNPERGWIVTANHAVVPPSYYDQLAETLGPDVNYVISNEWERGYRGQRIEELVTATSSHTPETLEELQGDNHSLLAEEHLPYLFDIQFEDPALTDAADWLRAWDLQSNMDSPQAALFAAYWDALVEQLWNDQLDSQSGGGTTTAWATQLLLDQPNHDWWDDTRTPEQETRDDILTRSLESALEYMTESWGADRDAWRWGAMHTATFVSTPLGQSGIGLIENLVNAGPVEVHGGTGMVNNTAWRAGKSFEVQSLPSLRMIVDLGDLENSRGMHTTGQSGHPLSPHYADMIDPWRRIQYHTLYFGDEAVSEAAASELTLKPALLSSEQQ